MSMVRKFNNRVFRHYTFTFGKPGARDIKKDLQSKGYFVRVTKSGSGYRIWISVSKKKK